MNKNAKRMLEPAQAPGRPNLCGVPSGDRPAYSTGEGLQ
jgi:hypothetical protein